MTCPRQERVNGVGRAVDDVRGLPAPAIAKAPMPAFETGLRQMVLALETPPVGVVLQPGPVREMAQTSLRVVADADVSGGVYDEEPVGG
jgi:hypothetical protein